jgi:hypothetical protein
VANGRLESPSLASLPEVASTWYVAHSAGREATMERQPAIVMTIRLRLAKQEADRGWTAGVALAVAPLWERVLDEESRVRCRSSFTAGRPRPPPDTGGDERLNSVAITWCLVIASA